MAAEGIITLGIGSSPGGLFSFLTLGLTENDVAGPVTPVVSRSIGIDSNPSDTLSLNSNQSGALSVDA